MANGNKGEYDRILETDVLDFWTLYDLWLSRIQNENQTRRARKKNEK